MLAPGQPAYGYSREGPWGRQLRATRPSRLILASMVYNSCVNSWWRRTGGPPRNSCGILITGKTSGVKGCQPAGIISDMGFASWIVAFFLAQAPAVRDYQKATALFAKHDLAGAEAAVDESLHVDPRYVPALTLKARLAMISGRMNQARRTIEAAIAVDPKQKAPRFLLGFCLYLENDFQRSRDALALADQNDARVNLYRALSEEGLNQTDSAVRYYERSLELDPLSADARVAYARLLRRQAKLDQAESLIDEALRFAPDARNVLYEKGQCRFERGAYAQAAAFGERALVAPGPAPAEREIRFLLTRAYLKAGAREMAAKHRAIFERLPPPLVR